MTDFGLSEDTENIRDKIVTVIEDFIDDECSYISDTYDTSKEIPMEDAELREILEERITNFLQHYPEVKTTMLKNIDKNKDEILNIINNKIKNNKKEELKL